MLKRKKKYILYIIIGLTLWTINNLSSIFTDKTPEKLDTRIFASHINHTVNVVKITAEVKQLHLVRNYILHAFQLQEDRKKSLQEHNVLKWCKKFPIATHSSNGTFIRANKYALIQPYEEVCKDSIHDLSYYERRAETSVSKLQHKDIISQTQQEKDVKAQTFKILIWTPGDNHSHTLGSNWFGIKEGSQSFDQCSYSNCMISTNKTGHDKYGTVLFHMWLTELNFTKTLPKGRLQNQKWVMFIGEAPGMATWSRGARGSFSKFNNLFNATWTYHSKSDIQTSYHSGYFKMKTPQAVEAAIHSRNITANLSVGKSKIAAWFCSNCLAISSKRLEYVYNLQQHIQVDIYGKCGPLKCENEKSCLDILHKKYKFYLSFENALCDNYVTEKIWKIISNINVIPVVLGATNYTDILPPGSYIDVADFKTPKDLAAYMNIIDKNDTLFNSYFEYRNYYDFIPVEKSAPACQLCQFVNENEHTVKIYDRMGDFWNESLDCKKPEVFYKDKIDNSSWVNDYCKLSTKHAAKEIRYHCSRIRKERIIEDRKKRDESGIFVFLVIFCIITVIFVVIFVCAAMTDCCV